MFANDKRRLFRILARADEAAVRAMAERLQGAHEVVAVKPPEKTLAMVRLREPVQAKLFYLGEVIVWEAAVTLDGAAGMAVTMDGTADKALAMAVIDAAVNRGVFEDEAKLHSLEATQRQQDGRENAMHRQTAVHFTSMDAEMPHEATE